MPDATTTIETTEQIATPTEISNAALFAAVPPVVRAYILLQLPTANELAGVNALPESERDEITALEFDVFYGIGTVDKFADALWSALPWDDKEVSRAKKLAINILGYVFLPTRSYVGDVAKAISALGGNPATFPQEEISERTITYEDAVIDIQRIFDPDLQLDLEQRDRLGLLIEAQLRGERTASETADRLMRTQKTGGLELTEAQANALAMLAEGQKLRTAFLENPVEAIEESSLAESEVESAREYTPEEIRAIYAGSTDEQTNIRAAVSLYPTDSEAAATAFAPPTTPIDPWQRLGAVFVLAQRGTLPTIAKKSPVYSETVRNYFSAQRRQAELATFEADPAAAQFLNIYLQISLKRFAGFSESASARYAVRIVNLLKKSGLAIPDLAAFDHETGDFRWITPM